MLSPEIEVDMQKQVDIPAVAREWHVIGDHRQESSRSVLEVLIRHSDEILI